MGLLDALKLPPTAAKTAPGAGGDAAAKKAVPAAKAELDQAWSDVIDFAKGVRDVSARGELLGKLKSADQKRQQAGKPGGDATTQLGLMRQAIAEIKQAREATQERSEAVPRAVAQRLRGEVQKTYRAAYDAHTALEAKQKALKARADAAGSAVKPGFAVEQQALEKQLAAAGHRRDQAYADANALDDPETGREQYLAILGRQKSGAGIAAYTEIDSHDKERKLPGEKHVTRTTTSMKDGVVQVDKTDSKRTVGFDGVTRTQSREREVQGADQTLRTAEETKTNVSLKGVTREETRKSEIEHADGRKLSVEDGKSTEIGKEGVKQTKTRTVTRGDGSSTATSKTASVERGEGKVGVGGEQSTTRTDSAGNEKKQSLSAKGGAIAGDGGYGGYGSGKGSVSKQGPGGLKAGAVGGLSGAATCVIGEPAGEPLRYPVKTTVRIGASLGASAGHEKKGGDSKGSVDLEAEAELVFEQTHQLEADELKTYLDAVRSADKGGKVAATWKELTILSAGVSQGLQAARRAMSGQTKLAAQVGAREGESASLSDSEAVGGKASADIKAVKLGVEGKKSQSHSTSATRNRQGGIDAVSNVGSGESLSGTAGIGMGVVEGEAGRSHSLETAMGYKITIDAAQDPDGALLQEFHACRDARAQEAFIARYEKTQRIQVTGKTASRKEKDGDSVAIAVAKVKLKLGSEHGTEEERETDRDGKLVKSTVRGSSKSGGSIGVGSVALGDSGAAEATATRDGAGNASLDVTDTKSSTNLRKLARKLVGMDAEDDPERKKKKTGLLADAAGRKKDEEAEEAETQDRDISGISVDKADLQRIVAIAKGDPARWSHCVERLADYDAWAAVGRRIASSGDPDAAGDELALFVGSGSSSRRQVLENLIRPQGNVSMATRADFPESMKQWKKPYQELVVESCEARIAETAKKDGATAAGTLGQKLFGQLGDLLTAVSSSKAFVRPGVQAEMISAINDRKTRLLAAMRKNAGANSADAEAKAESEEYDRLMSECASYKTLESAPMERIRSLLGSRPRVLVADAVETQKLIRKLDDLYAIWNRDYVKVETLGKKIGKPAAEYAARKPDLSGLPKLKWACWSK